MAISPELQAQLNLLNCSASGVKGTGTANCPFNIYRVATLIFTPQGFEFEEAFSIAYLQTLQQAGKAIVLAKIVSVEDLTAADNETTETGSNIITTSGKSPYTYAFVFKNGLYFDKAIRTLESFGAYDVTYLDEKLSIICTSTSTAVKGFTLGQISVNPYKAGNGADAPMSRMWVQEVYRSERDVDATWITQPQHDIRLASLDGINQALVDFAAVPADGATTVTFTVKTDADRKPIDVTGLLVADLVFTKNGTPVAFSIAPTQNPTTKVYTGTFVGALAEDDVVTLGLNGIIKKGNRLYQSGIDTATVV